MQKINLDELIIVENYPFLKPNDLNEIMISNGFSANDFVLNDTDIYHKLQTLEYYALAQINEKTIGYLKAHSDRGRFYTALLENVVVHKNYQNQGVGSSLMKVFHKKFAHTTIWAMAMTKRDKSAVKFLEKFGYTDNSKNFTICTKISEKLPSN